MDGELIEDWQIIKNTHGKFAVSDRGRVCEILNDGSGGILVDVDKYGETNKKYKTIWLCNKKYFVHRLVALYFIPNPNGYPHVHHRDHNAYLNCVTNLEWVSASYNNTLMHWNKTINFNWETLKYD